MRTDKASVDMWIEYDDDLCSWKCTSNTSLSKNSSCLSPSFKALSTQKSFAGSIFWRQVARGRHVFAAQFAHAQDSNMSTNKKDCSDSIIEGHLWCCCPAGRSCRWEVREITGDWTTEQDLNRDIQFNLTHTRSGKSAWEETLWIVPLYLKTAFFAGSFFWGKVGQRRGSLRRLAAYQCYIWKGWRRTT